MNTKILLSVSSILLASATVASQSCETTIKAHTPTSNFTIKKDGVVIDKTTDLMWASCSLGQTFTDGKCTGNVVKYNWNDAKEQAKASKIAGFNDWRIPTIDELDSIVEAKCHNPSINLTAFPNTPSLGYWSSSAVKRLSTNARVMFFYYGEDSNFYKNNMYAVRLVRNK